MAATDTIGRLADFSWNFFYFILFLILISTVVDLYNMHKRYLPRSPNKNTGMTEDGTEFHQALDARGQMESEL